MISAPPRRSRHEDQVAAFLTSCDPAKVAEVESKYRVVERDRVFRDEMAMDPDTLDTKNCTSGYPARLVPGSDELGRRRTLHRRDTARLLAMLDEHAAKDKCQVCGSHEARCGCCG